MLQCCNSVCNQPQSSDTMLTISPRQLIQNSRSLRPRLVALLLLIAQLVSLLVVPMHAVAHAKSAYTAVSAAGASARTSDTYVFSILFGHEQGLGCDDWNAAFALDSHAGYGLPTIPAVLPPAIRVSGSLPPTPAATPLRQFLARAPPRI